METVSFTQMKAGTREEYVLLHELEKTFIAGTADRVLAELSRQSEESLPGYRISRLDHALQTATRAKADGADDDWVVAALLHDIGDGLAPQNHDRLAAEILRPYLKPECIWVVEHHAAFQMVYYGHHLGWNQFERDKHRDHPHYESGVRFCEDWDQSSFDPAYANKPLEFFEPLVRRVFSRKAHAPDAA